MSHGYGSERKNRRSRRPPSPSNSRTSPTERCYSRNYNENQLIFPMSLPQSTPDTQPVVRPVNSRHTSRYPLTESQRSTPYSSPSLGGARLNGAPFFGSSVSDTSATSPGSEGFASFQRRDYPIIPQRPPQPQPAVHINPQTGRVLTAADFARRHPLSPPSSSESSSYSGRSSVESPAQSLLYLPPPTPSTRPIPIPRASSHPERPFTPQHNVPRPRQRRPRNNTSSPPPGPSHWPPPCFK